MGFGFLLIWGLGGNFESFVYEERSIYVLTASK